MWVRGKKADLAWQGTTRLTNKQTTKTVCLCGPGAESSCTRTRIRVMVACKRSSGRSRQEGGNQSLCYGVGRGQQDCLPQYKTTQNKTTKRIKSWHVKLGRTPSEISQAPRNIFSITWKLKTLISENSRYLRLGKGGRGKERAVSWYNTRVKYKCSRVLLHKTVTGIHDNFLCVLK